MNDVAILGLGLMGGSLGLALKARGFSGRVRAYARRPETRAEALRRGVADEAFDTPAEAARGAAVVVVCAPVLSIPALLRDAASGFSEGSVVTDVGSTKAWLVREARAALAGTPAAFVGSHPIAGSERTGIGAAAADLYEGAVTVLTPEAGDPAAAVDRVRALWQRVGARVLEMAPDEHDRVLARTSHLPHLVAAALARTAGRDLDGGELERVRRLCGPGFRDTTRIAAGSPEMWHDIALTNRAAILAEVRALRAELDGLCANLQEGGFDGVRDFLEQAQAARCRLMPSRASGSETIQTEGVE